MNTPFRLDDHPRRPQPPLAPPPDRYFEQLPRRVMARVQPVADAAPAWDWFTALARPWRTALASVAVLGGFAASFLLSPVGPHVPAGTSAAAQATLARVPREQLVQYLLASEQRLSLNDLAELPAASASADAYLQASPAELQDALDAQPTEDYLL